MSTTAKSEWKHPMIVDEDALLKIEAILKRKVAQPKISISCADSTDHEFPTINALLKYENAKRSRIESLRFTAQKDGEWTKQARVALTPHEFRTLEIEVRGTQETAPRVRDDLSTVMERARAWYWPLYKVDFFYLLSGSMLILWIAANVIVRIQRGAISLGDSGSKSDDTFGILIAIALFGIAAVVHFLRGMIFPRLTFLIGQEIGRHRTTDKIQWGVVIAFFVSLAASIASFFLPSNG